MPARSTYQPPTRPPAIENASPRFTLTSPICWLEKPLSTQKGLTMKPIAASPSLNSRMKSRTEIIPGRDSSSTHAPKTGPSRIRPARGPRAATSMSPAPRNISPTGIAPRNHQRRAHRHDAPPPCRIRDGAERGPQQPDQHQRQRRDPQRLLAQEAQLLAHAARRRSGARAFTRRQQRDRAVEDERRRAQQVGGTPAEPARHHQHRAGGEHAHAVEADPKAVGHAVFALVEQLDRVAVGGDVVGGREHREGPDGHPGPRPEAELSGEQAPSRWPCRSSRRRPTSGGAWPSRWQAPRGT